MDINYSVASKEDQQEMFLSYCGILMQLIGRDLDCYHREYNGILMERATQSNNLIQDKCITISVSKKSIKEDRTFFQAGG